MAIQDVFPWLATAAIIASAAYGITAVQTSSAEIAIEIRHLSNAVSSLSRKLDQQEVQLSDMRVAVTAIPRTEKEVSELKVKIERIEQRLPELRRPGAQ